VTVCCVTADGRKRYIDYLQVLERVVLDVEAAVGGASRMREGTSRRKVVSQKWRACATPGSGKAKYWQVAGAV